MAAPLQSPNSDEIVSEIRIAAPRERVFQALVDPLQVVQWWGQASIYRCTKFECDLRVGGAWRSIGHSCLSHGYTVFCPDSIANESRIRP
ncbi:MAG TPA: SRPBCC domain-containing protein [Candidatus Acidoferrum sp.]|nr:SRPBCC domain-containing protein [Candidatus Acidoferrum sp.]